MFARPRLHNSHARHAMPTGPFASSAGVGRAEPEWAVLTKWLGFAGKVRHTVEGSDARSIHISSFSVPGHVKGVEFPFIHLVLTFLGD